MLCTSCISRDADSACGYHWQASWKLHASAYCLQRRWGIETKRVTVQVWTIWDSGTNSTSVGNRNNNAKMTSRHVWRLDYYCYLCYGGFCRNRSSSLFLTFSWFSSSHVYSVLNWRGKNDMYWQQLTLQDDNWSLSSLFQMTHFSIWV